MATANVLEHEKSPYLLQHAGNPVHWQAWGSAALAAAKEANKPILLSVGYAACHWCHVMAHESFEDAETADLMNALFVNVKVDREERPDIDAIYMAALHALGEQGGWPLTMFLTPDGTPFWGGTYFPPEPRWGRPSFRQILQAVADAWARQDQAVATNGGTLIRALTAGAATSPGDGFTPALLSRVAGAFVAHTDPRDGGLRGAPKFPNTPIFRFLWQQGQRTADPACAGAVRLLLTRMSLGGIYDHLGGGYARYSTDAEWLVPHFEKMLYDNAQILELLALAHAADPEPLFAGRAEETVWWMQRDMAAAGAFAASEDADSEGEEGRFYVWSAAEIDALLGPAASAFRAAYDVTEGGNWEGKTILRRVSPLGTHAQEAELAVARATLLAARERRVRPGRDDKILADWNGLAIAALVRASGVFDRPEWLALARDAFAAVLHHLGQPDGRVAHAWRDGRITAAGLLDDQACMARASLALFEATGEPAFLDHATDMARAAQRFFADTDGSFFTTAADARDVPPVRPRTAADNATPNANGLLAEVFARLFHLTGEAAWAEAARAIIAAFSGATDKLTGMSTLLASADLLENATTIVVVGDPAASATQALLRAALTQPDPATVVLRLTPGEAPAPNHPAFGKMAGGAVSRAYLCRAGVCSPPVHAPADLRAA